MVTSIWLPVYGYQYMVTIICYQYMDKVTVFPVYVLLSN